MTIMVTMIGLIGGPASVLCIGENGHIAIEASADGSCESHVCEAVDADDHNNMYFCSGEVECCDNCVDLALKLDQSAPKKNYQPAVQFALCLIVCLLPEPAVEQPDRSRWQETSAPPEIAVSWQFDSRAALPVRAPSFTLV